MRILLAVLALAIAAPAAAASDVELATIDHDTGVATYGGRAVWSEYDPVERLHNLMTWTAQDGVVKVPVPESGVAFDADLGPTRSSHIAAVYSRRGRVYLFDFTTGRERRLRVRGHDPSLFRGRVAVLRRGALRTVSLGGRRPHVIFRERPKGLDAFDIADNLLAYVTNRMRAEGAMASLRVRNLRSGVDRLVRRSTSGALSHAELSGANFDRRNILGAIQTRRGAAGNRVLRYDPRTQRLRQLTGHRDVLDGGLTGDSLVYLRADGETAQSCVPSAEHGPCSLRVTRPFAF